MTLNELLQEITDQFEEGDTNFKAGVVEILEEAIRKIIELKDKERDINEIYKDTVSIKAFVPYVISYRNYLDSIK